MKQACARIMLKNCRICMKEILKYGGHIAGEQPGTCGSWRDEWADMKEQLHVIKLHGCAFGLRDPSSGLFLKKSWHIVTSDIRLKDYLDKQCPGGHRHIQISGSLTPFSAGYPLQFCKKVAQYLEPIKWSQWVNTLDKLKARPDTELDIFGMARGLDRPPIPKAGVNADPDLTTGDPEIQEGADSELDAKDMLDTKTYNQLVKVHNSLGHPHNRTLSRMLKDAGAR